MTTQRFFLTISLITSTKPWKQLLKTDMPLKTSRPANCRKPRGQKNSQQVNSIPVVFLVLDKTGFITYTVHLKTIK